MQTVDFRIGSERLEKFTAENTHRQRRAAFCDAFRKGATDSGHVPLADKDRQLGGRRDVFPARAPILELAQQTTGILIAAGACITEPEHANEHWCTRQSNGPLQRRNRLLIAPQAAERQRALPVGKQVIRLQLERLQRGALGLSVTSQREQRRRSQAEDDGRKRVKLAGLCRVNKRRSALAIPAVSLSQSE